MIHADDIIGILVEANPDFHQTSEDFLSAWENEGHLPYYLLLGDTGFDVAEFIKDGDFHALAKTFEMIENLHVNGDHYVKEAASLGLLESIQNNLLADNFKLESVESPSFVSIPKMVEKDYRILGR